MENLKAASGIPVEVGQRRRWQKWADRFQREFVVKRVAGNDVTIVYDDGREEPYAVGSMEYAPLFPGLAAPAATMDERVQQVFLEDTEPFAVVDPFKSALAATIANDYARDKAATDAHKARVDKAVAIFGGAPAATKEPEGLTYVVIDEMTNFYEAAYEELKKLVDIRGNEWSVKTPWPPKDGPAYQHTVKLLGRLAERDRGEHVCDTNPMPMDELAKHILPRPTAAPKTPQRLCGMVCTNPVSHPDSPLCEKHIYQAMVARDEARRSQVPSSTETGLETSPKQSHVHPRGCLGVWNIRGGR
jgi:hypothetical protein